MDMRELVRQDVKQNQAQFAVSCLCVALCSSPTIGRSVFAGVGQRQSAGDARAAVLESVGDTFGRESKSDANRFNGSVEEGWGLSRKGAEGSGSGRGALNGVEREVGPLWCLPDWRQICTITSSNHCDAY